MAKLHIPAYNVDRMPSTELQAILDEPDAYTDDTLDEAETELDRRDYDADDPWSPLNHHD